MGVAETIYTLLAGVAIIVWAQGFDSLGLPWPLLWAVGAFCVTYFLEVALHEAGHLLAACVRGLQPVEVKIGNLQVDFRRKGLRLGWWTRPASATGHVLALPLSLDLQHRRRSMLWFIACGPLADTALLAAALCGLVWSDGDAAFWFWAALSLHALSMLILAVWPAVHGLHANDGRLFMTTLSNPRPAEHEQAWLRTVILSLQGVRPRHWPLPGLDEADHPGAGGSDASAQSASTEQASPAPISELETLNSLWLRTLIAADRREWREVCLHAKRIEAVIAAAEPMHRSALAPLRWLAESEEGFARAMLSGESEQLRTLELGTYPAWRFPAHVARRRATLAALEGDAATCDAALADLSRHAHENLERGMTPVFVDQCELIRGTLGIAAAEQGAAGARSVAA